jgi:hypothetical protein
LVNVTDNDVVITNESPAAYSQATSDEVVQDMSFRQQRYHVTDAILSALGFNPFLGIKRADHLHLLGYNGCTIGGRGCLCRKFNQNN